MVTAYEYDVWDGKEIIAQYCSLALLQGQFITIYEVSEFKRIYNRKNPSIKIPLMLLKTLDNGIDLHYRMVLDVRKKSERQLEILLNSSHFLKR